MVLAADLNGRQLDTAMPWMPLLLLLLLLLLLMAARYIQ